MLDRLRTMFRIAAQIGGAAVLAGCPQRTAVWIPSGATTNDLLLAFGEERGHPAEVAIGVVEVWRCDPSPPGDSATVWRIRTSGIARPIRLMRYGVAPPGFTVEVRAVPIGPGCYLAQVSGTGATRFRVGQDGKVTDEGRPW